MKLRLFSAVILFLPLVLLADEDEIFVPVQNLSGDVRLLEPSAARKYGVGYELSDDKKEIVVGKICFI